MAKPWWRRLPAKPMSSARIARWFVPPSGLLLAFLALPSLALELTLAHVNPPGEPTFEAFARMGERLAQGKTGLKLKIFSRSQIGDEKDSIEQVRLGAITMASVSNAALSSFAPSAGVLDIPFLFRDHDKHPWAVADGPIGKRVAQLIERESGLVVVGWSSAGMRHVFSRNKPIHVAQDLKGHKIRVIGSRAYIDTFNGFEAKPTPMPYGEVYTALATGTIDAAENDTSGYRTMKFYEQAPYLSLTGHFFLYKVAIANKERLARMTPEQRAEFDAALAEAIGYQRELFKSNFIADLEWLQKEARVSLSHPDRQALEAAVRPVQEKYIARFGRDIVNAIRNTQ